MVGKYLTRLTTMLNITAIVALIAILLIMFIDIVLRYTIKVTILGAYEIIEYLMVIAIGFCLAHTEVMDGHVKVTMITERFGPGVYLVTRVLGYLLQAMMLFFIMVANFQQARYIMVTRASSAIHKIPAYPFYFIIAISFGVFGLVMVLRAIEMVRRPLRN